MAALTEDNAFCLRDTAGVLTRPEGKCRAPASVGNQHAIKVFFIYIYILIYWLLHAGKHSEENYNKPLVVLPPQAEWSSQ